jgi:transposase
VYTGGTTAGVLEPLLETIASLSTRVRHYDHELERLAREHYPETELLRQVQGVGALTVLTFVLTLEEPGRFEESRSVGAYLGLVPSKDQSGERDPQRCASRERATRCSDVSWWAAPTISLALLERTVTSGAKG